MNIVFFAHPHFLGSQSMPRFANMLLTGMKARGWNVTILRPTPFASRVPAAGVIRKWLGYIDQYIVFPISVKKQMKKFPEDTLFVFTDQALGPWVPLVSRRSYVIHCHDFLAQRSAQGRIPENPTGWLGRQYQAFIHRGYARGKYFISVSQKTKEDLHAFLPAEPVRSEVIYNGLNQSFEPHEPLMARAALSEHTGLRLGRGYLLHIGGNQWYKNRAGVIEIYNAWRSRFGERLPLLMIGKPPDRKLMEVHGKSRYKNDIHWIENLTDRFLPLAYAGASVFLFPSLAEGFGWPIAEAMACGCPVITTDARPMTEVAGNAAFLISVRPRNEDEVSLWASEGANAVNHLMKLAPHERRLVIKAGLSNAKRFDREVALDRIEKVYREVLSASGTSQGIYERAVYSFD